MQEQICSERHIGNCKGRRFKGQGQKSLLVDSLLSRIIVDRDLSS